MIYFDNAATTPLLPEVIDKMSETMKTTFGNPSSLHAHGRMASKLLRESREQIAQSLHTLPNRIFFTSGGSESNNTVIKGYCLKHQADGKHIITTALEHHAVLEPIEYLVERFGFEVTIVQPRDGRRLVISRLHLDRIPFLSLPCLPITRQAIFYRLKKSENS